MTNLFCLVALDWGGPRREWFELICKALFDTSSQLFTRFSDNNQALVSLQFPVLNSQIKTLYIGMLLAK